MALCVLGMALGAVPILFLGLAGARRGHGGRSAVAVCRHRPRRAADPGSGPVAGGVVDHRRCGYRTQPGPSPASPSAVPSGCRPSPGCSSSPWRPSCWRPLAYAAFLRPDPLTVAKDLALDAAPTAGVRQCWQAGRSAGEPGRPRSGPAGHPDHRAQPRDDGGADGDDPGAPDARRGFALGRRADPQPPHRRDVRPVTRVRHPVRPARADPHHPAGSGDARLRRPGHRPRLPRPAAGGHRADPARPGLECFHSGRLRPAQRRRPRRPTGPAAGPRATWP